jgi:septal ring factor EnvC (AmiA/AmiB activator)
MSYLRLLLSVEQPADFVRGYRFVTTLARQDRERVATFRRSLQALEATRTELLSRSREAEKQKADLEQARRSLDEERRRKTALLTRIVERKEAQATYLDELAEAEKALDRLVGGLEEADVEVPMALLRGSLPWPAPGRVRSGFGRHKHPRFDTYTVQNGIEIEADPGTDVHAVHEGVVAFADRFRGYGLMVVVDHGGKHHTLYARLGELRVQLGDHVHAGDVLGITGIYGIEEPGLYFEVRSSGHSENPVDWLARR